MYSNIIHPPHHIHSWPTPTGSELLEDQTREDTKGDRSTYMKRDIGSEHAFTSDQSSSNFMALSTSSNSIQNISLSENSRETIGQRFEESGAIKLQNKKIPRPPNAFILYRSDKQAIIKEENPKIDNKDISRIIGEMWNDESASVRQSYYWKAKLKKSEHERMYPDYSYHPKRKKQKQ